MIVNAIEKIREAGIEKMDCVTGTVIKETVKGALISFGNGGKNRFIGLAYTSLTVGAVVLCSVRKIFEDGFVILSVDSLLERSAA